MPLNVQPTGSPWEAFRLTSKAPSELYDVLGPGGVDGLVRHALVDCWNALPAGERSLAVWRKRTEAIWDRNMAVWRRIKKPSPAAFFEDMHPDPADGHLRQALVMTWMMLPRGKRDMTTVRAVIQHIFQRQLAAWAEDEQTLRKGRPTPSRATKPAAAKPAPRKNATKEKSKTGRGRRPIQSATLKRRRTPPPPRAAVSAKPR